MEKLSTAPGLPACLIVHMKEQSILFPLPFTSANDRITQKQAQLFWRHQNVCVLWRTTESGTSPCGLRVLVNICYKKKNSSKQFYSVESCDVLILFLPCWLSQTHSLGCCGHVWKALGWEWRFRNVMCTQQFNWTVEVIISLQKL